jgi:hypothetical protein
MHSSEGRRRKKAERTPQIHNLCPEPETLAPFMAHRANPIFAEPYPIGALVQALPSWLGFLQDSGLLSEEDRRRSEQGIAPLLAELRKLLVSNQHDPVFAKVFEA